MKHDILKKSRKWNINKEFRILYKDCLKEIINFILVFPKVVLVKHLYGYLINDIIFLLIILIITYKEF